MLLSHGRPWQRTGTERVQRKCRRDSRCPGNVDCGKGAIENKMENEKYSYLLIRGR
jgi:hypothetical protein